MPIDRRPLREQIKDEVLRRLERGEFDSSTFINEPQLAATLGVSRTPLREALIALEREGVIQSQQGKGFRFAPTSPKEFRELCPVLAALEGLALEQSDPAYLRSIAPRLLEKARQFTATEAEHGLIERYDDEWHDLLLSGCPNDRLMELITSLKLGLRRYERLVVSDTAILERAAEEHERIVECVIAGDMTAAVRALKVNWQSGMERILERLEKHPV